MNSETKYGDRIPEGHWEEDDEDDAEAADEADVESVVQVADHTIVVDDDRDAHDYEHGIRWHFGIEDGDIVFADCGHYFENRTQWDPMGPPAWGAIPTIVKARVASELGVAPDEDLDERVDFDSRGVNR